MLLDKLPCLLRLSAACVALVGWPGGGADTPHGGLHTHARCLGYFYLMTLPEYQHMLPPASGLPSCSFCAWTARLPDDLPARLQAGHNASAPACWARMNT